MSRPRYVPNLCTPLSLENICWKCRLRPQQRLFSTDRTFVEASRKSTRDDGPTENNTKWRYSIYATPLVRKSFTSKPGRRWNGRVRHVETLQGNTLDGHGNGSEARGKTLAEALSSHLNDLKPFPRRSPNPMLESVRRSLVDATLDKALDIARHQNTENKQPTPSEGPKTSLAVPLQGIYRSKTPVSKGYQDSTRASGVITPRASPLAKPGKVHLPGTAGEKTYTTSAVGKHINFGRVEALLTIED